LLVIAHLQPVLPEVDAVLDHVPLEIRTQLEKPAVLLLRAEAHDVLDSGAVVPAPVEDHDFSRRWKVRNVALHVHLALLAVARRGERNNAEYARTDALGNDPDQSALAGCVAAFEYNDDALPLLLDPVLQHAQFNL